MVQKYHPDQVTILPDQHRKFNVPSGVYVDVNKLNVRSKNAFFSEAKNPIRYEAIVEQKE